MIKNFLKKLNVGLLFINIFLLQSYLIRFQILNIPTNLQEVLIGLQTVTFLLTTLVEKDFIQTFRNIRSHWVSNTFILLTTISILTVDITDNVYFIRHLRFLFFAVLLSFIFIETFKTEQARIKGLKIMGIGAVAFGLFSAIYNLLGNNITHDFRLLGPLDAAVYLAYFLAPFFIFFTIQFFENRKDKTSLIFAIIAALLIIATRSIGAISGTFLVLSFYYFKRGNLSIFKTRLSKAILAILTIIIVGTIFYAKILPAFQTNYSSLNEREEIWITSLHFLKDPMTILWGLGYGQFQNVYFTNVHQILGHNPLDYYVLQPHNILFLFILQYGFLGLFFLFICLVRMVRTFRLLPHSLDVRAISSFIILYFFLHGMIDTPFFKNDMLFLFILFFELGMSRGYLSPETKSIKTA